MGLKLGFKCSFINYTMFFFAKDCIVLPAFMTFPDSLAIADSRKSQREVIDCHTLKCVMITYSTKSALTIPPLLNSL
jgi:hypothetical protein